MDEEAFETSVMRSSQYFLLFLNQTDFYLFIYF